MSSLQDFTADFRSLVATAGRAAGLVDPLAFSASHYTYYLTRKAVRGPLIPIDGPCIREWAGGTRLYSPGTPLGIRLYSVDGIPFARVATGYCETVSEGVKDFFLANRTDHVRLYRIARRAARERAEAHQPPVMSDDQLEILKRNTIGYLDRKNLQRIRELGGRPKRGLLLAGPPGNGKTSACRWLWQECLRHGHEYKMVTPDAYRAARNSCNPVHAVRELFAVHRRGVIFFDDMDIALRDRNAANGSEDQAVFLGALDGIEANEGVVYLFTTNCEVTDIDPAFRRPGRIDLTLRFQKPDAALRRGLVERWNAEIPNAVGIDRIVTDSEGMSFAELDEMKNLLIVDFLESSEWSWDRAKSNYRKNRADLVPEANVRPVGFTVPAPANGRGLMLESEVNA